MIITTPHRPTSAGARLFSWLSRQPEWAKFAQENPNSPAAAPQHYTRLISTMSEWDASYLSMALDKDATQIEHCQTIMESLKGKKSEEYCSLAFVNNPVRMQSYESQ